MSTCTLYATLHVCFFMKDYPSVGQIRRVLIQKAIVPVFAVTGPLLQLYNNIVNHLDGTNAATAELFDNSRNLLSVIETAFEV